MLFFIFLLNLYFQARMSLNFQKNKCSFEIELVLHLYNSTSVSHSVSKLVEVRISKRNIPTHIRLTRERFNFDLLEFRLIRSFQINRDLTPRNSIKNF